MVIRKILYLFLFSRLIFIIFALVAFFLIPLQEGYLGKQNYSNEPYLVWIWANFDGRHFSDIAISGYRNFNFAFFPLYPLLIRIIYQNLIIVPIFVGILISLVTFFLAMFMIYKIARLDFNNKIGILSVFLLAFFPLSFFYHSMYSDSLFLLLAILSFYFARKRMWLWSGVFGGLASLTRLSGIALIPALVFEWYVQNKENADNKWKKMLSPFLKTGFIAVVLTACGTLSYMIYLQIFFGDFLLFQKALSAWNQDQVVLLPQVIFRYLKIFLTVQKDLLVFWIALFEFLTFFLYMGLAIYVWKKVRASYGAFMVILLLLVTFTGTLAGTQRYILHMFPAFLGLGLITYKNKVLKIIIFTLFIMLAFIFTGLFTRGYWIA